MTVELFKNLIGIKLLQCYQRKQPGKGGLGAFILVDAVRHQPISTAAGLGIIERHIQVIVSEKPIKAHDRIVDPCFVPGDVKGFDTSFDHGIGFDGLLVETCSGSAFFMPTVVADGHKVIVFGLDGKQPLEGVESHIDHVVALHPVAGQQQGMGQFAVGIA